MRRRDIKVGMAVRHAKSFKQLGVVSDVGAVLIAGNYPDGDRWIATPVELIPDPYPKSPSAERAVRTDQ